MKIEPTLTDDAILAELGQRLSRRRLDLGLSQAALAREAGLSKRTVERMEAGASTQLSGFIRVLRTLDLLAGLESLAPRATTRPMELLRGKGRQRQRAPRDGPHRPDAPWTWDDQE